MTNVYLNYPHNYISVHRKSGCPQIQKNKKPKQRKIIINSENVDVELQRFNACHFRSNRDMNDMWVRVCLDDEVSEMKVIEKIFRHKDFYNAKIIWHCKP